MTETAVQAFAREYVGLCKKHKLAIGCGGKYTATSEVAELDVDEDAVEGLLDMTYSRWVKSEAGNWRAE